MLCRLDIFLFLLSVVTYKLWNLKMEKSILSNINVYKYKKFCRFSHEISPSRLLPFLVWWKCLYATFYNFRNHYCGPHCMCVYVRLLGRITSFNIFCPIIREYAHFFIDMYVCKHTHIHTFVCADIYMSNYNDGAMKTRHVC